MSAIEISLRYAHVRLSGASANCHSNYKVAVTTTTLRSISNGDYVKLIATSASSFDTPTTLRLTINDQDLLWTVRTRPTNTGLVTLVAFATIIEREHSVRVRSVIAQVTGITDATTATLKRLEGVSADNYASVRNAGTASFTIAPGGYIQLSLVSSSDCGTTAKLKPTVGGIERIFAVRARALDATPENLGVFRDATNAVVSF